MVTTASLQDRDGAFRITAALREAFSTITLVWADAGYTGRFVRDARKIWDLAVAIVKRPDATALVRPAYRHTVPARWAPTGSRNPPLTWGHVAQ